MRLLSRKHTEILVKILCIVVTIVVISPLLWIIGKVIYTGLPAWNWNFFTTIIGPPESSTSGIGPAIEGTFIMNGIACLFGIPLGIFTGIYLAEYAHDSIFASVIRTAVESMAGVPSLIMGLFAAALIVENLNRNQPTALAGSFALGLMIIPLVARATEESMRVVSNDIREAAIALGIPKWRRTLQIVVGIASGGIISGALLAFARISGETAPLLFTAYFNDFWPTGVNQAMASLQVYIYNNALQPYSAAIANAWGAALLLILIVLGINIIVRIFIRPKYQEGF